MLVDSGPLGIKGLKSKELFNHIILEAILEVLKKLFLGT